jgi:hypothetical protein
MRKLLAVTILSLTAVSGWAQGTITFRNGGVTFTTTADRLVYLGAIGGTGVVKGTNYHAALYYLPGGGRGADLNNPAAGTQAGDPIRFRAVTSTGAGGEWVSTAYTRTLAGVDLTQTATLQVRVWDYTKYATFAEAFQRGEYGWSTPFDYTVPPANTLDPRAYLPDQLRAFAVVPEPSTIALGVLGVASLLFLRRRK